MSRLGDNNENEIVRAGLENIEISVDIGSGVQYYTLLPCDVPRIKLDKGVGKIGMDDTVYTDYFQHSLDLLYFQVDSTTLADIYSATVYNAMTSGVNIRLTFLNGTVKVVKLACDVEGLNGEGYNSPLSFRMTLHGRTLAPVHR